MRLEVENPISLMIVKLLRLSNERPLKREACRSVAVGKLFNVNYLESFSKVINKKPSGIGHVGRTGRIVCYFSQNKVTERS